MISDQAARRDLSPESLPPLLLRRVWQPQIVWPSLQKPLHDISLRDSGGHIPSRTPGSCQPPTMDRCYLVLTALVSQISRVPPANPPIPVVPLRSPDSDQSRMKPSLGVVLASQRFVLGSSLWLRSQPWIGCQAATYRSFVPSPLARLPRWRDRLYFLASAARKT